MDTGDLLLLAAAGVGIYLFMGKTTPSTTGTRVYVSPTSWAAMKAEINPVTGQPQMSTWHELDATPEPGAPEGEWDSFNGTFIANLQPYGLDLSQAVSWFKGLNLNPTHNQNYMVTYRNDIVNAARAGLLSYNPNALTVGSYRTAQGISGIYGCAI